VCVRVLPPESAFPLQGMGPHLPVRAVGAGPNYHPQGSVPWLKTLAWWRKLVHRSGVLVLSSPAACGPVAFSYQEGSPPRGGGPVLAVITPDAGGYFERGVVPGCVWRRRLDALAIPLTSWGRLDESVHLG
jgi:hypothetical protein